MNKLILTTLIISSFSSFANNKLDALMSPDKGYSNHCMENMQDITRLTQAEIHSKDNLTASTIITNTYNLPNTYYEELDVYLHNTDKLIDIIISMRKAVVASAIKNGCRVFQEHNEIADFTIPNQACAEKVFSTIEREYGYAPSLYKMKSVCFGDDQIVFSLVTPDSDQEQ